MGKAAVGPPTFEAGARAEGWRGLRLAALCVGVGVCWRAWHAWRSWRATRMPVSAAAAQDAAAAAAVAAALAAIRATDAGDAEEPGGAVERGFAFASDAQCSEFAARVASGRARASCAIDFPYADVPYLKLRDDARLLERMYCFHDPDSAEATLYNFVQWKIQNLEAQSFDKDAEGTYQVCAMLRRHARSTGVCR